MVKIWAIDKKFNQNPVMDLIACNYPVRKISSFSSFKILTKIEKERSPDLVIVDVGNTDLKIDEYQKYIETASPNSYNLYLSDRKEISTSTVSLFMDKGISKNTWLRKDTSESELLKTINFIINRSEEKKYNDVELLIYRDLELDYNKLQYRVHPEEKFQPLSLKEAQLLKWFMKHPNTCWTREKIRQAIWHNIVIASRSIDSQISRLRKRLQASEACLDSIYGGGYILK